MLPLSEDIDLVKRGYTVEHRQETDRHHFPVPHVPVAFAALASPRMLRRIDQFDFCPPRVLTVNAGARAPRGGVTRQGVVLTDLQSLLDCQ